MRPEKNLILLCHIVKFLHSYAAAGSVGRDLSRKPSRQDHLNRDKSRPTFLFQHLPCWLRECDKVELSRILVPMRRMGTR
jgi:hypothetical protein